MAKRASKADRREQILQAAVACFSRKGYHLTTMDDIVAESGLSKGSLYWHYKSKKDLLLSIMEWYFSQMEQEMEGLVAATPGPTAKLRTMVETFGQIFENPELLPLFSVLIDFYAETRHDEEVTRMMVSTLTPYLGFIRSILDEGTANGEFKPVDSQDLALAIMAAYDGIYLYRLVFESRYDWSGVSRALIETLLTGLAVAPGAAKDDDNSPQDDPKSEPGQPT